MLNVTQYLQVGLRGIFLLALLTVPFVGSSSFANSDELPDSYFDDGYEASYRKWLHIDAQSGQQVSWLGATTFYQNGATIGMDRLFQIGQWKLHRVLSYNYLSSDFWPVQYQAVQVGQAPLQTQRMPVEAQFYISKNGDLSKTLIIQISAGQQLGVMYKNEERTDENYNGDSLAREFISDFESLLKTGLIYKNGVLEFRGTVGFLQGVDDFKSTWDDFIFPDSNKQKLQTTIDGFINEYDEENWSKYGIPLSRGVLLYGPPGTGKSFIARVIASNILNHRYKNNISYIHVSARHISSVDSIRQLYQVARDLSPSVIFFEDIDLIAGTDRTDRADIKNELMQQLSGLETLKGVLTIGTTNVAERIDPALTRSKRLGFQFEIGLPNLIERIELYHLYFRSAGVTQQVLDDWAAKTEGYSGADIKELYEIAFEKALVAGSVDAVSKAVIIRPLDIESAYVEKTKNHISNGN